jgi:D-amino-acid dehydrogenase
MSKVAIVGAGVIGLSIAYELIKEGHSVEIIDQGSPGEGCSYGNAGMIVPSHFVTLPSPGVVAKALRWMTYSTSPFSVRLSLTRPSLDFLWKFYLHANRVHVEKHMDLLIKMHLHSRGIYQDWEKELDSLTVNTAGITMLYNSVKGEKEEKELAGLSKDLGIPAHFLSKQELEEKEPGLKFNVLGGIHYELDAHLNPEQLMKALREKLIHRGAVFHDHSRVTGISVKHGEVTGFISKGRVYKSDYYVMATGAWSEELGRSLGINLPVRSGKGYSFIAQNKDQAFQIPKLINEDKVTLTPFGENIRFGGTMQLGDRTSVIQKNRIRGILNSLSRYFPDFPLPELNELEPWHGFRPVSPDGLPYLGALSMYPNVIIASGHAMMGISLAASTGRLVSKIIGGEKPEISISEMNPERFNK